jgi:SecY interacting protein Syd
LSEAGTGKAGDLVAGLGAAYVALARERTGELPVTAFDPDWPSPCVVAPAGAGLCYWQPQPMPRSPAFARLGAALEVPIQPDLVAFYGARWSAALPVRFEGNDLQLLQLWSDADFDVLLSNLIGHALEKKRVRQPLTLFFALVDDDRFLSVDNSTGEVLLETVGRRQALGVADDLAGFLRRVEVFLPAF